jgi:hypothetical protein
VTLFAPKARFVSTDDSQFDAMMAWRAELELAYLDEGDTPEVFGGYADFLTIRLGEHPVAELLDSLSQDAENFADLFDGDDVNYSVEDAFSGAMPFNRALIVTMAFVAHPLRGHDLGAWLVAEVIARMAGAADTLVLLYPSPADAQTGDTAELEAVSALTRYWQRAGLMPIDGHPGFLGQSTAYTTLPEARRALRVVEDVQISVPTSQIVEDQPPSWNMPRHMIIADGALDLDANDEESET